MADRKELLTQATDLGLEFPSNIKTAKLANLISEATGEPVAVEPAVAVETSSEAQGIAPGKLTADTVIPGLDDESAKLTRSALRHQKLRTPEQIQRNISRMAAFQRTRVIVACVDPKQQKIRNRLMTVSNDVVGDIRMAIPYNNANGWYVPNMMLSALREAKCVMMRDKKMENGDTTSEPYMGPMYNITVLPELTKQEVADLAAEQAKTGRLED